MEEPNQGCGRTRTGVECKELFLEECCVAHRCCRGRLSTDRKVSLRSSRSTQTHTDWADALVGSVSTTYGMHDSVLDT